MLSLEVNPVDKVSLLEVLESLISLVPLKEELTEVHVAVSCDDVIWSKNLHAAKEAAFQEVVSFFHLVLGDEQLGHDAVDGDMQRMRWP